MKLNRHHGGWVIILSLMVTLILAIMPLPVWAAAWRPDWSALVLIYWCIATPQRVSVATGWVVGIFHDVLYDTLLGQHALTYCFIAYLCVKWHRRIRLYPLWQQAMGVFLMVAANQFFEFAINNLLGHPHPAPFYTSSLPPAITSMFLWPWLFVILRDLRRTYRVF